MLNLSGVALRRGRRLLFENVSLQVQAGHRVGLVGANGSGKTSLFAAVLGELEVDQGEIALAAGTRIAHVAQASPSGNQPALEFVMDGDPELRDTQRAIAAAENRESGRGLHQLYERMERIDGFSAEARAARLLNGLGFAGTDNQRPVEEFSGGWRMRLNLAQALMCRSDLLLLDEPTNHLDLDAVIWLENWLRQYRGTLLLISHDRDFLDSVCSHILHIEQCRATLYSGNYSAFETIRAEQLANQQAAYEKQQREIAHMHSYVERFRASSCRRSGRRRGSGSRRSPSASPRAGPGDAAGHRDPVAHARAAGRPFGPAGRCRRPAAQPHVNHGPAAPFGVPGSRESRRAPMAPFAFHTVAPVGSGDARSQPVMPSTWVSLARGCSRSLNV